ncbi:MAG: ATP-binding protein [Reyranella sp.]|uniref:AAA family ATPase n=1 Tax=Reyranella sp. TaxID=1929291 RepID=UPI0025CEC585|nr:ATP-binding protein [Reyranella sp.]MBR2816910.1 ATP-binding protein [Reyranella sp.]
MSVPASSLQVPTLHMICGKIAAGKSTLAARLAQAPATVLVSEDYWMSRLYEGEVKTVADYGRLSARLRKAIGGHLATLLRAGLSIVLDFPANTVANRHWMRTIFEEAASAHRLHFLDLPDEACRARLHRRNAAGTHEYVVSDAEFDAITRYFQPPTADERFETIVYREAA